MKMSSMIALLILVFLAWPSAAVAGELSETFDFQLGEWLDIETEDGPVTLHRLQLDRDSSGVTRSRIFRPGRNSRYTTTVRIRLEYSNRATRDWDASIEIEWLDADGEVIDGYRSTENLDEGEVHDMLSATLSTLEYGLDKARRLRVRIDFFPE